MCDNKRQYIEKKGLVPVSDSQQERYVLRNKLGSGAMGTVWLATDKYLKITQESVYKELFISEARALASLNHPNITQIYDAVLDENNDRFFLVMEYVEGTPLSKLIADWSGPCQRFRESEKDEGNVVPE